MGVGLFPLLEKEGWPRHQQKVPVPKRSGRGGQFGEMLKTHSETFRRADHPGCAISVASRLFVSAQPPLLFKEGKASCPHFSCFIATFLLESLLQEWPISSRGL